MPITITAETWKETIDRLKEASVALIPGNRKVFIQEEQPQRGKIRYFLHVAMNVPVELNRRNAQIGAKIIVFGIPTLILLYTWQ